MLFEVSIDVIVFTLILFVLVFMILLARKALVPSGNVKIKINHQKEYAVPLGGNLLTALGDNGIYLSAACGGKGSCGQCRCIVEKGGGDPLPAELAKLSKKDIKSGWRLSCQTAVKQDMDIEVEASVFGVKSWDCEVISNENVATYIKELTLKLPEGEEVDFKAGGYVELKVPAFDLDFKTIDVGAEYKEEWEKYKMFDLKLKTDSETTRAYSMANYPAEKGILKFNIRVATPPKQGLPPGKMSSYVFNLKKGDKLKVNGPFGEFFPRETDAEMIYVGGGAGMAPLRSHIFDLLKTKHSNRKISYWYGARSKKEMFYTEELEELTRLNPNFSYNVALSNPLPEDNWSGYTGFIHNVLLEQYLKNHPAPEDCEYYMCGPLVMSNAVISMLENLGVDRKNIMFDDFGS